MLRLTQLTPPGRGAIATLQIDGPGALAAVAIYFRAGSGRPLDAGGDRLVVGHFGPPPGEQIVVRAHSAELVELHCHGGHAASAVIEEILAEHGCQTVGWQDWIARHEEDPIAAAARAALAEARTERTASILLDQYHGALRRAIERIESLLARGEVAASREEAGKLLLLAPLGRRLIHPWQVVIAGRPNVGKSSLINALLGFRRAIVHQTAGTTRDVVTAATALEGWPVELSDTAGLRTAAENIEQAGIELAQDRLARADLVVLVFDRSEPVLEADEALLRSWPAALVVENKSDLPAASDQGKRGRLTPCHVATSALRSEGIDALVRAIAGRLVPDPPPPGAGVPFTEEQIARIEAYLDG
jgi:tRNA modification GTPase